MTISLKDISIGYSAPLVSAIDAELSSGDFICLVGRNGTGKSTLLKTISSLTKPLHGEVQYSKHSNKSNVALVLTQVPDLPNTTVFELVSYGRIPYLNIFSKLRDSDIIAANQAIETVGINKLRDRKVNQLSDGEKQKAMIARAIAQGSDVILLDEPSAFLDYPSKHELMILLKRLAHECGKAILLSSHDLDLVKTHADKVWKISDRRMIIINDASEVFGV